MRSGFLFLSVSALTAADRERDGRVMARVIVGIDPVVGGGGWMGGWGRPGICNRLGG